MKYKVFFPEPKFPPHRWIQWETKFPIDDGIGKGIKVLTRKYVGKKAVTVERNLGFAESYAIVFAVQYELTED